MFSGGYCERSTIDGQYILFVIRIQPDSFSGKTDLESEINLHYSLVCTIHMEGQRRDRYAIIIVGTNLAV